MRFVVAIDSFKGCLSSREANQAAATGIRSVHPDAEIHEIIVSDGGEGFLEAFHAAVGGEYIPVAVKDPLGRDIEAQYLLKGHTAILEMARAGGLTLLTPEERDPLSATSYGTGQLVADAVRRGATHIIVGLGGSATSDAGRGMLRALEDAFGRPAEDALPGVRFTLASDVDNPLFGENGAAQVYGPQKGATEEMVAELDARARRFAEESARRLGYDRSGEKGAGAAGGLGYAFLQYLKAECRPGIALLLEALDFDAQVAGADLVITGEGSADRQTLMGKLPSGILAHAGGVPVWLVAGRVSDRAQLLAAGFARVECINPPRLPREEALKKDLAQRNLAATVQGMCVRPSAG